MRSQPGRNFESLVTQFPHVETPISGPSQGLLCLATFLATESAAATGFAKDSSAAAVRHLLFDPLEEAGLVLALVSSIDLGQELVGCKGVCHVDGTLGVGAGGGGVQVQKMTLDLL